MMSGKFKEYNWRDIERLIFLDSGLDTEELQRTKGELWFVGGFDTPQPPEKTILRLQVYDKDFSDRLKEHQG